jgi:amino acid transporter
MEKSTFVDTILGRPLASDEEGQERLGAASGIGVFGLDALSSAAYGPEAALTVLLPLGALGALYILPITAAVCALLGIVYLSYRQTIAAYPLGGGSYTVATENLGPGAGLLAAAALMTDYLLNVAVGISAGVGAIISAVPLLHALCLVVLLILTIVNLRGTREAGVLFMVPTALFVGTLLAAVWLGLWATLGSGGHPRPVISPPHGARSIHIAGIWLLLRAFASGCTATTGVEAVSNGVPAFRQPAIASAQRSLGAIIAILTFLHAGIACLAYAYGIVATISGSAAYQSVLSQLLTAVAGKGVFYATSIISIVLVLCLSANTSFADFPRLCRAVAEDGQRPVEFAG